MFFMGGKLVGWAPSNFGRAKAVGCTTVALAHRNRAHIVGLLAAAVLFDWVNPRQPSELTVARRNISMSRPELRHSRMQSHGSHIFGVID